LLSRTQSDGALVARRRVRSGPRAALRALRAAARLAPGETTYLLNLASAADGAGQHEVLT
jgi:hypothetical protein